MKRPKFEDRQTVIATPGAAAPAGPYSQAVSYRDLLFVSGQRPVNPETGSVVIGFEAQTRQAFANLRAILEAGGASLSTVLKVNIYLASLAKFDTMNGIYREFFSAPFPVRTTVGVALRGILIEVDAVAYRIEDARL